MKTVPSGFHTKIKHKIIKYHFSSTWKNIFKSEGPLYSLYYVDLYSGPGKCINEEIDEAKEKELPDEFGRKEWKPPFFDLMEDAIKYDFDLKCLFNDINEEYIEKLKEKIAKKGLSDYIKCYFRSEDANEVVESALDIIGSPNRPSLFYLDPSNHKDLHFSTVKKIMNFKDDSGRRPDLIINFMVHTIFMAYKRGLSEEDVDSISKFLGEEITKKELEKIRDQDEDTYKVLLDKFLEKLKEKDYSCTYYLIRDVDRDAPLYYLIFATANKRASKWHDNIKDYVDKLIDKDWMEKIKYDVKPIVERDKVQNTLPWMD